MQVNSKKFIKYLLIFTLGSAIGTMAGYNFSSSSVENQVSDSRFCQKVEEGLTEEMEKGFVNCFQPTGDYFELREDIENSTSLKCVCRKKVGESVQELKIAQPTS